MTIDLTTARKGDRFEARDGEVGAAAELGPHNLRLAAKIVRELGPSMSPGSLADSMQRVAEKMEEAADPAPSLPREETAPEAGVDGDLPKRLRKVRDEAFVPSDVRDCLSAAAARIEALTRALEEAGRVIAPFADVVGEYDDISEIDETPGTFVAGGVTDHSLTLGDFLAGRDWHSKHGGGANG